MLDQISVQRRLVRLRSAGVYLEMMSLLAGIKSFQMYVLSRTYGSGQLMLSRLWIVLAQEISGILHWSNFSSEEWACYIGQRAWFDDSLCCMRLPLMLLCECEVLRAGCGVSLWPVSVCTLFSSCLMSSRLFCMQCHGDPWRSCESKWHCKTRFWLDDCIVGRHHIVVRQHIVLPLCIFEASRTIRHTGTLLFARTFKFLIKVKPQDTCSRSPHLLLPNTHRPECMPRTVIPDQDTCD